VPDKSLRPSDPGILEVVRYLEENAFGGLSMEGVAKHTGFSRTQFTRKFQAQVGVAPSRYLTELRMQKVRKLLVEMDCSMEQIAEQCGYKNAFYLSRVFTKMMNMNPSLYRKTHRA
jgi:transcriptional regulator GlxA family with amidase domain